MYENEFSAEWVHCVTQSSGMNEKEKEEFLEEFARSEGTLVGFCVMGGIFSEGIDLMGEEADRCHHCGNRTSPDRNPEGNPQTVL